ncbi:hypothetical protein [Rhizobium mesoamericanum]|uniref:Transmembrane protein n=1 Tax=Rhizobium mesoamericanum STM3625 TaxID=1211777 RepID=K0PJ90_9HYPH|nr:hypothetical protein [Rhizobium mesoamericanum]CCM76561.1 conserved exported hypothetical protein [Rhizobium mesoamericanum STM3625]
MSLFGFIRRYVLAVALVPLLITNSVVANEPAAGVSMADFMKSNPDCTEFSDQCSICAVVDGKAACSTPKIACIKKPYICTRRGD